MVILGLLQAVAWDLNAYARDQHGVAVIIGNKTYTHERVPAVDYAHRDAAAFKRYVLDVLGFDPANIIDLRDATQAEILGTFGNETSHKGKLWRFLDPKGRSKVVVFFSGHGVPGTGDRRGYLLPSNADPNSAEINGFPIDLLYRNLSKLTEAASIRVYLDACFSGDSPRGRLVRSASPIFIRAKLPEVGKKLTVLTAASGTELASWDEDARHGLFTHHLLDALYGRADANNDKRVTATEVKAYLDREMTRAARRTFGREQHASLDGFEEAVLSFAPADAFPSRPILAPAKPKPPPPSRSSDIATPERADEQTLDLSRANRVLIQRGLNALKRDAGPADGLFGPKTRAAIRSWQESKGFTATGYLSEEQARALIDQGKETQVAVGTFPKPPSVDPGTGPRPGDTFKDCADCPEMVVVPSGSFMMGSAVSETTRENVPEQYASWERPRHPVSISRPFAVGKFEVTRRQFNDFVDATGHRAEGCYWWTGTEWKLNESRSWRSPGFGQTDRDPVTCVNWEDATAYVSWLSRKTGESYRLLSESEWEYVARAGTSTARFWGDGRDQACDYANAADLSFKSVAQNAVTLNCRDGHPYTAPVGSFAANRFGLHDVLGNVWEWVEDCWNEDYSGAPANGRAWMSGDCGRRVLRGGSWLSRPGGLRAAVRVRLDARSRDLSDGFRVARTLF
jgi:formylglycine-generating enzyme required for sulfatase activity